MARKVTMTERLLQFGLSAGADELDNAIETLKACKAARSPKPAQKRTRKPKEPKTDATSIKTDGV